MKSVVFTGSTLETIRNFPSAATQRAGYQLELVQRGGDPTDWKPLPSVGKGVREIRIHIEGEYRVLYVTNIGGVIYVLHAFEKKDRRMRKADQEAAKRALKKIIKT